MSVKFQSLSKLESQMNNLYSDGKYKEAIQLGEKLLENAKASEDIKSMMIAYLNLAGAYYNLGQIENAFNFFLQYKQLCDEHGDTRDRFHLYNLSAIMYAYDNNYEKAKEMIQECINIALELKMFHEASVSYNTYSTFLNMEGLFSKAGEIANISLKLAKEHSPGDVLLQCQIYTNIAFSKIGLKELHDAKNLLFPLEFNPYLNDHPHEKAYYLYTLALYYKNTNNANKQLDLLQQAYTLYSIYNDKIMLKRVLKNCIILYDELGDLNNAYRYMKEYIEITEQLSKIHLSSKLTELDIKNSISAIEKRANIDGLTGIYNRYYLEITCNQWIKDIKETGEHVSCIIFDIDDFKKINDTFGHLIGDEVIKKVAQTTKELFKSERAIVGRYGGDEFLVFLKGYDNHSIMKKAQQLFYTLTNICIPYLKNNIRFTVSMGVVCTDSIPYVKRFSQIFKLADQALYMAKKDGKNQIVSLSKHNCMVHNLMDS